MDEVRAERIEEHLHILTRNIGVRLAGSAKENEAAEYVAEQLERAGARVRVEEFPVRERRVEEQHLAMKAKDRWETFPCSLLSNTPGTGGKTLEAPVTFFEGETEYQRRDLSFLAGAALVHLGVHIESREAYARLMEASPLFILFVDVRYPGSVPLADGMFPAYTDAFGAVPCVNVAFMDAWRWKREGAERARLKIVGGMGESVSRNVIAEWPGKDAGAGVLYVGAHHDTQADSPGADDNGSGVAGLIELARVLAGGPRRRTIRLISFGAEEQLSVGSAAYVRRHRKELGEEGGFMMNLDSFGSLLGWTELIGQGPSAMFAFWKSIFENGDHWIRIVDRPVPYADHFPFVAAGLPATYLGRNNCSAGRFFHHRPDDDMTRISPRLMASLMCALARGLDHLAECDRLPFPFEIPFDQRERVQGMWEDLFGGW